jgi:hypothetical protein
MIICSRVFGLTYSQTADGRGEIHQWLVLTSTRFYLLELTSRSGDREDLWFA